MKNLTTKYTSMKRLMFITLPVVLLMMVGCGEDKVSNDDLIASGDVMAIRAKKKELSIQQSELAQQIAELDSVIGHKEGKKNLPLVTTYEIKQTVFDHFIELQGDVMTRQNVLIYPETPGILKDVRVKEGDRVNRGQLLAVIEDGGISSQLIQMETQMALSKTTFERQGRLWDQNIGSEIQYLQAKSSYEVQKSAVAQMKSQMEKFQIRAPFSGIIDDVVKQQGTVVSPGGSGSEIFRIINLSEMYLEVPVPENYISTITKGKEVKVIFPVLGTELTSKVRQTGNFINPNNRSFSAEISVPNTERQIKPNMTAKVLINDYKNESAIMIPQSVISENAEGEQYVFLAQGVTDGNGVVKKVIITTGKTNNDLIEVLSGLKSTNSIIQEGARSVRDGQEVKIIRQ
ncbi:MAG: membrane fusion protein (multidrug efflux system) [Cyclobacteriaceae bacterium]|jgi:membrane fusion protein (multidrug efflux system)